MEPFTHDLESVELTDKELAVFCDTVDHLCQLTLQHALSNWLMCISGPQSVSVQDYAQTRAREMWRTVKHPDNRAQR